MDDEWLNQLRMYEAGSQLSSQRSPSVQSVASECSDFAESRRTRKVITSNGMKKDITFLDNKLKKRKNSGQWIRARSPVTCTRRTPDKLSKLKIIQAFHRYISENGGRLRIRAFQAKYKSYRGGWLQWINKLSVRTWHRYSQDFHPGSPKFRLLKNFVARNHRKKSSRKKRFYIPPCNESFGVCPIFEHYMVIYREKIADDYQWRSVAWWVSEGQRILNNRTVMRFLKHLMDAEEPRHVHLLKCTKSYINRIIVCYIIMNYDHKI